MTMDRPISQATTHRRRAKRTVTVLAWVGLIAASIAGLRTKLTPSLNASKLRLAVVETGDIQATIQASGTVIPEQEIELTSPYESTLTRIMVKPGDVVQPGTMIAELDATPYRQQLAKLQEQMQLKKNEKQSKQLALDKEAGELAGQLELKQIESELQSAKLARYETLQESGLVSQDIFAEVQLATRKAEIDLRQVQLQVRNAEASRQTELHAIDLQIQLLQNDLNAQEDLLQQAQIRSDRPGMVTMVMESLGRAVTRGEKVASIANLDRYRIRVTLSDVYSSRLQLGQSSVVSIIDRDYKATLVQIHPTIENGIVSLILALDEPHAPELKPNLRVEAQLVTGSREHTLKVAKSPFITGPGPWDVFVVQAGKAEKRQVQVGLINHRFMEIEHGLEAGELIVLSDMSRYEHMQEITLK